MTFEQIMKGFLMFCVGLAISLTLFLLAVAVEMMQQKKLDAHRLLAANGQIAPSLEKSLLRRPDAWKEIERGLE